MAFFYKNSRLANLRLHLRGIESRDIVVRTFSFLLLLSFLSLSHIVIYFIFLKQQAYDFIPKELLLSDQRRFDAMNVILSYQNADGGIRIDLEKKKNLLTQFHLFSR
jgi:hypothetical protein